jgi:UDP-glucose 4-epimerase
LDFGKTDGEVFNVGSTEVVTIQELAELVLELTGSTSIIEYIDPNEKYGPLFDETRHRVADTSKIEKVLGWEAKMTLRESLTDIYSKLPITR